MAAGGGRARVLATLNPAGMDVDNWMALGIDAGFAANQQRVLGAFRRMGVVVSCTCTPYLAGNLPRFGERLAWAESSAVCYANSVIGARSNREGGPSALAAALTGRTPAYGLHLDENRSPGLTVQVEATIHGTHAFGALGFSIGERLENAPSRVVYIRGVERATLEELKSFCASLATFGGAALFHMESITPEAGQHTPPAEGFAVTAADLRLAREALSDADPGEVDFVSLGCPHLSIHEITHLAELLAGRTVRCEFWITTSQATRAVADRMGYSQTIEASGAKFAVDTCCVVAPIGGRFHALATDSAKACYYAAAKHKFRTLYLPFDEVVQLALE
jgi:predicted aconitase